MAKNNIYIVDVTNRDGVQTSRIGLAKLQKTMLNIMLNEAGVKQSEFGFPFTQHEANYLNANIELAEKGVIKPMILSGWMRAVASDVDTAFRLTEVKDFNLSVSTSDQMIIGKFQGKKTKDDVIKMMVEALKRAKELGARTVGINAEDASRTDEGFLLEFCRAARDNGADRVRYCDTLGYDDPFTIYSRIKNLAEELQMPVELHCHNDLGMAVACSVAGAKGAVDAGVDAYINTTINGVGERAGNADLLSVALALKYSSGLEGKYSLQDLDLKKMWKMAKYASYAFGIPIPINQPGTGENAFAHESGIHADGALKDRRNYELYDFREIGRGGPESVETGRIITAGEYSGIKGFEHVCSRLGIEFRDKDEAGRILETARYSNLHTQKPLTDDEIRFIAKYPDIAKKIMSVAP